VTDEVRAEEVTLTMPAQPQLLRVARLAAAGLAGRLGFNFDEIEDVKIAVDELCFALVGTKGRSGDLTLTYRLLPDALEIEGTGDVGTSPAPGAPSELSVQILAAVVDEHELTRDGTELRFRLRKSRVRS
jgi:anti-sigma regulatory factor (Ser/Thr protein kinase)